MKLSSACLLLSAVLFVGPAPGKLSVFMVGDSAIADKPNPELKEAGVPLARHLKPESR